jgi:hypothetical protein
MGMALSDSYVVRYLLKGTADSPPTILWTDLPGPGYRALLNGIEIELLFVPARDGGRHFLTFSDGIYRTHVSEPAARGVFRRHFAGNDEEELAELFRDLVRAASRQCTQRTAAGFATSQRIRETILRRLLFNEILDNDEILDNPTHQEANPT